MKQCPYCGSMLNDGAKFCVECGKPLPEETPVVPEASAEVPVEPISATPADSVVPVAAAADTPTVTPDPSDVLAKDDMPVVTQMPSKKQMLSTFQYILLSLLYGLPVIGLVFLFIFGAGHPKNMSLKRFSAAMLILRLVFWIVLLALMIVAMVKNGRLLSDALGQLVPAAANLLKAIFA